MPAKIDADVGECLDIVIGCLREIQGALWQIPSEAHKDAMKEIPELDAIQRVISVFRYGNYEEARQTRPESDLRYLR